MSRLDSARLDASFYSSFLPPYLLSVSSSAFHVTVLFTTLQQSSQSCRQMEGLKYKLSGFLSSLRGKASAHCPVFLPQGRMCTRLCCPPASVYRAKINPSFPVFLSLFIHHSLVNNISAHYHTSNPPVWRQRDCFQCMASLWIRNCWDKLSLLAVTFRVAGKLLPFHSL